MSAGNDPSQGQLPPQCEHGAGGHAQLQRQPQAHQRRVGPQRRGDGDGWVDPWDGIAGHGPQAARRGGRHVEHGDDDEKRRRRRCSHRQEDLARQSGQAHPPGAPSPR